MNYIFYATLSAFCYGIGQLLARIALKNIHPVTATTFGAIFSVIATLLFAWWQKALPTKETILANPKSYFMMAIFGIIMVTGTILANYAMSMPEGKVAIVNVFSLAGALAVATVLALIFLREALTIKMIIGLILVIGGILVLMLHR
ncbi:MAG: EamA family transporter [Candidatus Nealsonbacteria bacterium]|nr:EamA family transporter [Candidatus Nealsonbacteria bacterium]